MARLGCAARDRFLSSLLNKANILLWDRLSSRSHGFFNSLLEEKRRSPSQRKNGSDLADGVGQVGAEDLTIVSSPLFATRSLGFDCRAGAFSAVGAGELFDF